MKTLFKTTIVILSEYNPEAAVNLELSDLVWDSEVGEAYCLGSTTETVSCEDLEGEGIKEFFNCLEEEEN